MNIVHLSAEKTWRGGEQQIAYLIDELNKLNQKQLVICRKNSAFEIYCKEQNIPYKSIKFKNQFDIKSSIQVKNICKSFHADVMHLHSSHAHAIAVWSYYLGNPTPMVLSRKVDFPVSKNILSNIKYNCKGIKKIICVSNAIKEIMQQSIDKKSKLEVVYDGIDLEKFKNPDKNYLRKEFNLPADKIIIANTSALADHKDYPTFIKAIKYLKGKINAQYFIIGDGPLKNAIQNLVIEEGLEKDIIFTGFRNDIKEILPSIQYFVLSSKTEGLGSSILDAYAAKVPVICTDAGGIKEIAYSNTAMINKVGDYQQIGESILHLINNKEHEQALVKNAYEHVQAYDKKIMASKTLAVYQQCLYAK